MIDKRELLTAFLAKLHSDLELLTRAALLARDEATNEESRAESKWDTRGQEAAYLAEGQAKLATELTEAINLFRELDPQKPPAGASIQIGSVFLLKQSSGTMHALMAPRAGGTEVQCGGITFIVITPTSPIGRLALGKSAGEFITIPSRRKTERQEILSTH